MVSAQKNTEFVSDNYDDIKKVVSIWICMDADDDGDGIIKYTFKPDILYGKDMVYHEFDKMEAYIIRIREHDNVTESKNKLIQMLEILLSKKKKEEVKNLLTQNHGTIMEISDTEQEVNKMCNLGEVLYERAEKEGIKQGIEQGIELKLVDQIAAKLKKGLDISIIADMLEEDEGHIWELVEKYGLQK